MDPCLSVAGKKKEDLRERVFFDEVRIRLGSSVGVLRLYSTC